VDLSAPSSGRGVFFFFKKFSGISLRDIACAYHLAGHLTGHLSDISDGHLVWPVGHLVCLTPRRWRSSRCALPRPAAVPQAVCRLLFDGLLASCRDLPSRRGFSIGITSFPPIFCFVSIPLALIFILLRMSSHRSSSPNNTSQNNLLFILSQNNGFTL